MKIAGLMPIRFDPLVTDRWNSLAQLCAVCDEVIVMDDNSDKSAIAGLKLKYPSIGSWIQLDTVPIRPWNDWTNRMMMLAEAARHGCDWVFWIDHDETIWPSPSRETLERAIAAAKKCPCVVKVRWPWLTLWDDPEQVRIDGFWREQRKAFLQKNPFTQNMVCWLGGPDQRLHQWPQQSGGKLERNDMAVLHYGMLTKELRQHRLDKYNREDPEHKFNDIMMFARLEGTDDSGAKFVNLKDLDLSKFPVSGQS